MVFSFTTRADPSEILNSLDFELKQTAKLVESVFPLNEQNFSMFKMAELSILHVHERPKI